MEWLRACAFSFLMLTTATGTLGSQGTCTAGNDMAATALARDTNKLTWDLFKEATRDQSKSRENVFLSAPSISAAFGMLYLGAKGKSAKELKETLFPSVTEDAVSSAYFSLLSKLKPTSKKTKLSIADGAFIDKAAKVHESYIKPVKKCFRSEVAQVDFRTKPNKQRAKINKWVTKRTQGRIRDLLPDGSITSETLLVLANAIYFKGEWLRAFKPTLTASMTFYGLDNVKTKTEMMRMTLSTHGKSDNRMFPFVSDRKKKIKAIELPYSGKEVSMIIVLPENRASYEATEKQLSVDFVNGLRSKMKPNRRLARLVIPKWKVAYKMDLVTAMKKLNLTSVFEKQQAELSGIADGLYVSGAFHKALVQVNEKGTKAAAASAVVVNAKSALSDFIADRPFIYMIWHKPTQMVLFVGRYVWPQ